MKNLIVSFSGPVTPELLAAMEKEGGVVYTQPQRTQEDALENFLLKNGLLPKNIKHDLVKHFASKWVKGVRKPDPENLIRKRFADTKTPLPEGQGWLTFEEMILGSDPEPNEVIVAWGTKVMVDGRACVAVRYGRGSRRRLDFGRVDSGWVSNCVFFSVATES